MDPDVHRYYWLQLFVALTLCKLWNVAVELDYDSNIRCCFFEVRDNAGQSSDPCLLVATTMPSRAMHRLKRSIILLHNVRISSPLSVLSILSLIFVTVPPAFRRRQR
jgi:hypothetical protein